MSFPCGYYFGWDTLIILYDTGMVEMYGLSEGKWTNIPAHWLVDMYNDADLGFIGEL